jgi:hypothetical protein
MSEYQKEQFEACSLASGYIGNLSGKQVLAIRRKVEKYLEFRQDVDKFINRRFKDACTSACFTSRKSACCSKEGIVTFFADVFINVLLSDAGEIEMMLNRLETDDTGFKCIYLGDKGCIWRMKPIVCQMFLCNEAKQMVFEKDPESASQWDQLKQREKTFTWPDQPVLFDEIEALLLSKGLSSPLMYLHNSPGLLRIKRIAGLPVPEGKRKQEL